MDNHIHLLLGEGKENLSQIMKRIGVTYAHWYNKKYERSGHLFQDRFKSENVEEGSYFLAVLRYIHQNPIKAEMVHNLNDYPWSSYKNYTKTFVEGDNLIDSQFALSMFSSDAKEAIIRYIQSMEEEQFEKYLDHNAKKRYSDNEVKAEISKLMTDRQISSLGEVEKIERNEILRNLKQKECISIRQIERITGIGRNIIAKA